MGSPGIAGARTPCSGRSTSASAAENTAVLSPMPNASVSTTIAVKKGFFTSIRQAKRRSCPRAAIDTIGERAAEDMGSQS